MEQEAPGSGSCEVADNQDGSQNIQNGKERRPSEGSIDAMIADLRPDPFIPVKSVESEEPTASSKVALSCGEGVDVVEALRSQQLQHEMKLQHLLDLQEVRIRVAVADVVSAHFHQVKGVLEQLKSSPSSSVPNFRPGEACSQPPAPSSQPPALNPQPPGPSTQSSALPGVVDEVTVAAAATEASRDATISRHPDAVLPLCEASHKTMSEASQARSSNGSDRFRTGSNRTTRLSDDRKRTTQKKSD